jgi:hypothetical protein
MGWDTFWAIFSQTHLVTLVGLHFGPFFHKLIWSPRLGYILGDFFTNSSGHPGWATFRAIFSHTHLVTLVGLHFGPFFHKLIWSLWSRDSSDIFERVAKPGGLVPLLVNHFLFGFLEKELTTLLEKERAVSIGCKVVQN